MAHALDIHSPAARNQMRAAPSDADLIPRSEVCGMVRGLCVEVDQALAAADAEQLPCQSNQECAMMDEALRQQDD